MKDKLFYKNMRQILYYINEYGIKKKKYNFNNPSDTKEFIENVHHGFYLAQKDIIFIMQKVLIKKKEMKEHIVEANKIHDKDKIKEYNILLEKIRWKENVLRSCADSIGWIILRQELSTIRRFYKLNEPIDISDSNFESVLSIVEKIYQENHLSFPLICDITTIFQVGDIICFDYLNHDYKIIEVKEGKENEKIKEIINNYSNNGCDYFLMQSLKQENEKFRKQFIRFVKQHQEMGLTSGLLNNDSGKEIIKGKERNVTLIEGNEPIYTYNEILSKLLNDVNTKNYSISCVDKCLLIAIYNNSKIPMERAFEAWARPLEPTFPIWDSRMSINTPLARPIYLYDISISDKLALTFGQKSIKMCLIFDEWIKLLEDNGIICKLLTIKQTNKLIANLIQYEKPFLYDGKALQLTYNNYEILLYDGILARIFSEHIRPVSTVNMLKVLIMDEKEKSEMFK